MFILSLFALLVLILLWDYFSRDRRKVLLAKQFKGPLALPIIGNLYMYLNKKPEDILPFSKKLFVTYGETLRIWAGRRLVITTINPRHFELLLSSQRNLTKHNMYAFLTDWLGTGLLLSSGQKWFTRRKIITPTFHFKILHQFVDVFNHQNKVLIEKLKAKEYEKPFDIYNIITLMSLDIICQTAMGVELNAQSNEDSQYVKAVKEITYIICQRMMKVWQRNDFIFSLSKAKKRYDYCLNVLHTFTNDIIEKRRKTILSDDGAGEVNYLDDEIGIKKKLALLDVLLKATVDGKPLTNADIAEEVDTFIFEGHDTVTSALTFGLYLLSQNPKAQQKIYEEVVKVVGEDLTIYPTLNQLQEMKYLECCIKEILRLYPPVPMYGRNLDEEMNLDGKIIPVGTNINMMIFNHNRNPKYFQQPDKFIPERFNEENERNENPFIYVPFSAGPRNCVGQKFAMLELKSTFCNVLRNFELVAGDIEPQLLMQLTLKSSNGTHVGFKQRTSPGVDIHRKYSYM